MLERPTRGRRQDNLVIGLRRLNVRRHAVFYFVRGESLVIARVVHQSRDITAGLFVDKTERERDDDRG